MTTFSVKTVALTALIAWGSLMPVSAHAAILRSSNGTPVLTRDGNCVTTNWEGGGACMVAKMVAGIGVMACSHSYYHAYDMEKTVYFGFNKSSLTRQAKHRLDYLAKRLRWKHKPHHGYNYGRNQTITVVGFADRLGNAAYNETLALKRAETVRAYLASRGVWAKKMEVRSLGKTEPRANCPADLPRAKLIHCLREDRRVEIEIGAPK